jgi:hypothetical protein
MAVHREEFLYVPHVDHRSALIAWGAFYLEERKSRDGDPAGSFRFKLLDDDDLKKPDRMPGGVRPHGSIGRATTPFGPARVRIGAGAREIVWGPWRNLGEVTFAWIHDLLPGTRYHYQVQVGGRPWAAEPCAIRMKDENEGLATPQALPGPQSFTTFPAPDQPSGEFSFAVIGDPGTGDGAQRRVGQALADRIDPARIRFVLTTGDNIYMKTRSSGFLGKLETGFRTVAGRMRMTGDEDDDWFTSYFLPYRDVISRVPVFPCLGNHDSENSEEDDDLAQLVDNLFLDERFPEHAGSWGLGDDVLDTLFYRFRFGRDADFIAVDTSFTDRQDGLETVFELIRGKRKPPLLSTPHREFLDGLLAEAAPRWRIPFGHHPPFSLGPRHRNNPLIRSLAQRFVAASPSQRVWLSGHEHNFQHHREGQLHYLLTGAAGKCNKLRKGLRVPDRSCCHNSVHHFLLVTVTEEAMRIRLIDEEGETAALTSGTAFPRHEDEEIVIPFAAPLR